jgi:hypothetical protein
MNNISKYDNVFLIDGYDNLYKIINILIDKKNKKNLLITNLHNKGRLDYVFKKMFTNTSYFFIDQKIIFGSRSKTFIKRIYDQTIIFYKLLIFKKKYKKLFNKISCNKIYFFSPIHELSLRLILTLIKHKKMYAYNFFKLKFLKKHFLSLLYSLFFKFDLNKVLVNREHITVGFSLNYKKTQQTNKSKIKLFDKKFHDKSILFLEDSLEQTSEIMGKLNKKKTIKNFVEFFKILSKKKYKIYYKTHPGYKSQTELFKKLKSMFKQNMITANNRIPSEFYIDYFKYIALGITSFQRNYFKNKIILNFKNFIEFEDKDSVKDYEKEFKKNLHIKNLKNNKYIFLKKINL